MHSGGGEWGTLTYIIPGEFGGTERLKTIDAIPWDNRTCALGPGVRLPIGTGNFVMQSKT